MAKIKQRIHVTWVKRDHVCPSLFLRKSHTKIILAIYFKQLLHSFTLLLLTDNLKTFIIFHKGKWKLVCTNVCKKNLQKLCSFYFVFSSLFLSLISTVQLWLLSISSYPNISWLILMIMDRELGLKTKYMKYFIQEVMTDLSKHPWLIW